MSSRAENCQDIDRDTVCFMYFVSLRLIFSLRSILEVKIYCEGQDLANYYEGSIWESY